MPSSLPECIVRETPMRPVWQKSRHTLDDMDVARISTRPKSMQIDKNTTDRKTNPENSTLKPTRRVDSAPSNRADGTAAKPQHEKPSEKRADAPGTGRKDSAKAAKGEAARRNGKKIANTPTAAEKPAEPSSTVGRDSDGGPTGKEKPVKLRFPSMDAIRGKIPKPRKRADGTEVNHGEARPVPRVARRRAGTERRDHRYEFE